MNKKIWVTGILVLLLALNAGCGQKPQVSSGSGTDNISGNGSNTANQSSQVQNSQVESNQVQNSQGAEQSKDLITQTIKVYYTDDQFMELQTAEKVISYEQEQEKYLLSLQALQSSDHAELFPLWEKAVFRSAKLNNEGTLVVDISLPGEARLGASGELLAVDSLKETLFQFTEVKAIELLVDGQQVESLMGHETLEYPLTRE